MRRKRLTGVIVAAAAAIGTFTACSDSGAGPGGGGSLAGTSYAFVSGFVGPLPATGTGSLAFTDTAFTADLHITAPLTVDTALAGGYQTKGDSIYLRPPSPAAPIPGTYAVRGALRDTLQLNLAFAGSTLATTWRKL